MNLKLAAMGAGVMLSLSGVIRAEPASAGGAPGTVESPVCGVVVSGTVAVEDSGFQDQMRELLQNNEWDKALMLTDQKKADVAAGEAADFDLLQLLILALKKDDTAVHAQAVKLGDKYAHNAGMLNEIAWLIATADGLPRRDLVLAEKLAARANEMTESGDAAIFDTSARIAFLKGDKEEAIAFQQQAVNNAADDQVEELKEALENYQNGKLPPADAGGSVTDALKSRLTTLLANLESNNVNDGGEADGNSADTKHYVQTVVLPQGEMVVVADGEFEPENQGSYSVRLYAPETAQNRFAKLLDGIICQRENGGIEDVLVEDLAGDGKDEIVVLFRNTAKNDVLAAEAFRVVHHKIQRVVSVANQAANADVVTLLAFKLKPAAPGTPAWFTAVEAAVGVRDDAGHGPTAGTKEWLEAVDGKLFSRQASGAKKTAVGSKKWCKAVDQALFADMR